MAFVLDASVTVSWALQDEQEPVAIAAQKMAATQTAYVPAIWWFEVRNVLLVNEPRRRLTAQDTSVFLGALGRAKLQVDQAPVDSSVLALARTHRLTVYDAAYLELAMREALLLATLDRALANAAKAENVPLLG
jgi:predicted nucleic acid-binding protein